MGPGVGTTQRSASSPEPALFGCAMKSCVVLMVGGGLDHWLAGLLKLAALARSGKAYRA